MNMREHTDVRDWMELVLVGQQGTAPPACLVVKSRECILKALTLTWHLKEGSGWGGVWVGGVGGGGGCVVSRALPDDLGFALDCQVIGYFLQGSPGNKLAQGQEQMEQCGFGLCRSSRWSPDYTRNTLGKDRTGGIKGGSYRKEKIIKKEQKGKEVFFSPSLSGDNDKCI